MYTVLWRIAHKPTISFFPIRNMYSKHRDLLGITPANNDVTGLDSDQTDLDGSSSDMDIYDSFSEDISTFSRNEAALFVLKARHVHKVAQSSICEVMCDFTSLLERSVHKLHSRVFEILDDIDPVMKNEVTVAFNSQDVLDPFRGMTTEHMQHSFFKKTFHLLVRGYFLIRIPTNGFFFIDRNHLNENWGIKFVQSIRTPGHT